MPYRMEDITGQKFGRLTALKPISKHETRGYRWLFKCDCGKTYEDGEIILDWPTMNLIYETYMGEQNAA